MAFRQTDGSPKNPAAPGRRAAGWWVVGVTAMGLTLVLASVLHMLRRDREALLTRFADDKHRELAEAAREVEEDLEDIGEDLRFVVRLVESADTPEERARELGALIAVVRHYRTLSVHDGQGALVLRVLDPLAAASFDARPFDGASRSAAREALARADDIAISPRLTSPGAGWYRVFARAFPGRARSEGAVAVVVDTEPIFRRLRPVASAQSTKLLLLSTQGAATGASDPTLVRLLEGRTDDAATLRRLAAAMRAGRQGTLRLPEREAERAGLGAADGLAVFRPIRMAGSAHWSVATITSTRVLRSHERAIVLRLSGGAGFVALLLVGSAAFFVVSSRRAVALRARLEHAEELTLLHEKTGALESQLVRSEKLATVGVLAAGIAHEIGTPLSVVRGRAEMILGKLGPAHSQAAAVHVIVTQIDLITRTIRQLLDFSRALPGLRLSVPVRSAAESVCELLRWEAVRRRVSLTLDVPDALVVSAEPDQLQQLLVNLVLNACDASKAGGVVRVAAARAGGGEVRLDVHDDGCGIDPVHREQIFDPFFTTKKRGQGTGLGLTIAARIARDHRARIELESTVGHGTRFSVFWPSAPGASEVRDAIAV